MEIFKNWHVKNRTLKKDSWVYDDDKKLWMILIFFFNWVTQFWWCNFWIRDCNLFASNAFKIGRKKFLFKTFASHAGPVCPSISPSFCCEYTFGIISLPITHGTTHFSLCSPFSKAKITMQRARWNFKRTRCTLTLAQCFLRRAFSQYIYMRVHSLVLRSWYIRVPYRASGGDSSNTALKRGAQHTQGG